MPQRRRRSSRQRSNPKAITISLRVEELNLPILVNAPRVLVILYWRMKNAWLAAEQIAEAERAEGLQPRGRPGPARSLPLLERLLTDTNMEVVWNRVEQALARREQRRRYVKHTGKLRHDIFTQGFAEAEKKRGEQHEQFYVQIWGAIHYAWARYQAPIVPRRKLLQAIRHISRGLQMVGNIIAPDMPPPDNHRRDWGDGGPTSPQEFEQRKAVWRGVDSWLLFECFPDDVAEVLDHWAPTMAYIGSEATKKARTVLAHPRPADRSGYDWSVFLRLLKTHWPSPLQDLCTAEILAPIAMAVLPDLSLTPRQVRDALRPSPSRRPH